LLDAVILSSLFSGGEARRWRRKVAEAEDDGGKVEGSELS